MPVYPGALGVARHPSRILEQLTKTDFWPTSTATYNSYGPAPHRVTEPFLNLLFLFVLIVASRPHHVL
jgi:hypothetical protein